MGASLTGQGTLTLVGFTGDQAQYVVLPHGLLRELHDATFEAWINWAAPAHDGTRTPWQRIFDFGEGTSGIEGEQASGGDALSYLFLTRKPPAGPRPRTFRHGLRIKFPTIRSPSLWKPSSIRPFCRSTISTEDAIAALQGAVEPMDSRWRTGKRISATDVP